MYSNSRVKFKKTYKYLIFIILERMQDDPVFL